MAHSKQLMQCKCQIPAHPDKIEQQLVTLQYRIRACDGRRLLCLPRVTDCTTAMTVQTTMYRVVDCDVRLPMEESLDSLLGAHRQHIGHGSVLHKAHQSCVPFPVTGKMIK